MFYIHLTLNQGLVLKKVHRKIKFIQNAWLKLYIDTDLKKTKNVKYGKCKKNIEILKCHNKTKKKYLISEPNCFTKKYFTEILFVIEMKKTKQKINMDKPVYLGLSVLES